MAMRLAKDPVNIGADAVRAAGRDGVAGGALLELRLATSRACGGKKGRDGRFSLCAASFAFLFDPFHDIAHGFGTVRREVHARPNRQATRRDAPDQHPYADCVVPVSPTPAPPALLRSAERREEKQCA